MCLFNFDIFFNCKVNRFVSNKPVIPLAKVEFHICRYVANVNIYICASSIITEKNLFDYNCGGQADGPLRIDLTVAGKPTVLSESI